MKMNFKKITAIASSFLMVGMTAGVAAAATYPAPFVSNGNADVAIVYGANAQASDVVQAGNIQSNLQSYMGSGSTGSASSVTGGDSFKFEKTSTKFHLGDNITDVVSSSLDEDELPTLLAEGTYMDKDNDEFDYTQKIAIGTDVKLRMFEDNDYKSDTPTVGFDIASNINVLTYTLTFTDTPLITDMPTTDLTLMGKDYYILSNTSTTMTFLDSAQSSALTEGESTTINVDGTDYEVTVNGAYGAGVKLSINGEITNSLATGDTQRLKDGSYIGIKEYNYNSKDSGVSDVEFSIGKGKLKIIDSSEVQINDDAVSGLTGTITGLTTNKLTSIALAWAADDDLFLAEDTEITIPGFESVKLSYAGMNYPAEETITVQQGGDTYATLENFPLNDGEADISFLYGNSTLFTGIGKDATHQLKTAGPTPNATGAKVLRYDKDTDDYFVVSWSDGKDAESYLCRFTNFVNSTTTNKTDLEYYKDGSWTAKKTAIGDSDTVSLGNAEIKVHNVTRLAHTVDVQNNSANTNFYTLYSKEGLTVYLPYLNSTGTYQGMVPTANTTYQLVAIEEDQNENKYSGDWINATIGWDSSTTPEVEVSSVTTSNADATSTEIGETDVWRDFTYSALATEILYDKPSSGQKSVKLIYHGDEVAADVYITAPSATVSAGTGTTTGATQLGDVLVLDNEVSSVSTKNLVVIGGSAVNAAAAKALGVAEGTNGAAFTTATGVEAGQFLIKGVADVYSTGKIALVVAGYEAADTVNAVTYLKNNAVDTSKSYKGTSSTSATLQVA